tara:strand:+ start:2315 stop:2476 length:162 start_codon:yes stop_codon:yes gene_type:complete
MIKNFKTRNGFIHLYNPKKEGMGAYDIHYINAYRKGNYNKTKINKKTKERYAA